MLKTQRIAVNTVNSLKLKLFEECGIDVSVGTILNLKPFFVVNATEREKVLYMCKLCLNTGSLFNALMEHHKLNTVVVSHSLSEYLMGSSQCERIENGYWHINCCIGKCSKCRGN